MKLCGITLTLICLLAAGCGSDDGSPCEQAGNLLCQMACDCGEDNCGVGVGGVAGTATISFDNLAACTDLYVAVGCQGGGEPGKDYSACLDALASAQCDSEAVGGAAVLLPDACQ